MSCLTSFENMKNAPTSVQKPVMSRTRPRASTGVTKPSDGMTSGVGVVVRMCE